MKTNKNIENLSSNNSNFTTATKAIGDALVAKGCSVPTGTSLSEMANILTNNVRVLIDLGITTSNTSSIGTASASSYLPQETIKHLKRLTLMDIQVGTA